jgi:prepilin-type N-terminal cleavage/methylation domain-containing protein
MKANRPTLCSAGFTLIEVMIATSLMALILVSAYACLSAGYATQKMVEPRAEVLQNARVALALMTADLRAACTLSPDAEFIGATRTLGDAEADNLDFATHNHTPRRPGEGDYCQESFYVDQDADTGRLSLWRRRNPVIALNPQAGGSREKIADGLRGLKLEYFDGLDWYATWGEVKESGRSKTSAGAGGNLSGLPNAVRITLYMDSSPRRAPAAEAEKPAPPLVFQTVACLNLAAASATAASATTGGTGGSPDATNPNASPNPGNNQ